MIGRKWVTIITRGMYVFGLLSLLTGLLLSAVSLPALAQGSGAIWTTTGSCGEPQNVNHYQVWDPIYINGSNFDGSTEYAWEIRGNSGGSSGDPDIVVASGTHVTNPDGSFCFYAYTVQPGDWGVYRYSFGNKNDNYSVDGITPAPAVTLDKTVTQSSYAAVGDVLNYSYVLTNTGNVPLDSPGVTDNKAAVSCPGTPDPLPPGESITCQAVYTITQADLNSGSVTNVATGTGVYNGTTYTATDIETVNAAQAPALTLSKTASPTTYSEAGDVIVYTLVATNTGNLTLTGVTISDPLLGTLACTQPVDLAPGGTLTCTGTHAITQADLDAGFFSNTAAADSNEFGPVTATETVTAEGAPLLLLEKTASPTTYTQVGDEIIYTLVATNEGNVTLTGVTISDSLLGTLSCTQPVDLAPGGTLTCTGTHKITQADLDAGSVSNTGTADSNETDPVTDTTIVTADGVPLLLLEKSASPTTYAQVGDEIIYTLVATNQGNVTLTGVTISDTLLGTLSCTQPVDLAPGGTLTCTGTHTITQADLDAGSVSNTGTADSNETEPVTDTETVTAALAPALTLQKTAAPDLYDAVGNEITYTLVATNTGNVTLTGVSISDTLLVTLTCAQPVDLAPGETLTCTGTYTITQEDLDAGSVSNTATADSNETEPVTDTAIVTADGVPVLSLVKTALQATYSQVGEEIDYSLTATNEGNVTLTGVSISDPLLGTLTCTQPVNLAPGGTLICVGSYTITQADLLAGSVSNTATADSNETEPVTDTEIVTAEPEPPQVTITVEDAVTCAVEPGQECLTFTVTISGLLVGEVSLLAVDPGYLDSTEAVVFTEDGEYQVTICGDWPGISDPGLGVEITLAGTAQWYIGEELPEQVGSGSGTVSYDPEMRYICFPLDDLLFTDPFCFLVEGDWTMAVQVQNPNDESVQFAWSLNGGGLTVRTAPANGTARLANLPLGVTHTIAIQWGVDGFAELRARLDLTDCESSPPAPTATPPAPPPTQQTPIPVTAVEPGPVVESAELIPVTGISLVDLFGQGLFRRLLLYLGLGFIGAAFIIETAWKRFR